MSSAICDVLRPHWAPGINNVTGRLKKSLAGWICDEDYLIAQPLQPNSFTLSVSNTAPLIEALAFDCTRMATAAFETQMQTMPTVQPPKGISWKIIKAYYSGFFAAHSILRVFGSSCSQLETEQSGSVYRIANACGVLNGQLSVPRGFYRCDYSPSIQQLSCQKINIGSAGVHETLWAAFNSFVVELSNRVLLNAVSRRSEQLVSDKLSELSQCLCFANAGNANWLSWVRNQVNYRHQFDVWYPYGSNRSRHETLTRNNRLWLKDPMEIPLRINRGSEIEDFYSVCHFLVGLCRVLVEDVQLRCSSGARKSFHRYCAGGYLSQYV